jgi:hypothetical protein
MIELDIIVVTHHCVVPTHFDVASVLPSRDFTASPSRNFIATCACNLLHCITFV